MGIGAKLAVYLLETWSGGNF